MPKVIGFGGVFTRAWDAESLERWYAEALGLEDWAAVSSPTGGPPVWKVLGADSELFEPSAKQFMVNLQVDDLAGVLQKLRERGDHVLERSSSDEAGTYGYVLDPEGTLVELFQAR